MFCRFCGNQIRAEAYVCPFCGRQLKAFPAEIAWAQPQPRQPSLAFFRLAKIFAILATVLSGITLFCGGLFIFMLWSGLLLAGDGGLLLVLYSIFALMAMIGFSPFALTTGILAFVFGRKSVKPTGGFPVFAFVFSIVAFVLGIGTYLLMIIQ